MGESRGGEGRTEGPTTAQLAKTLLAEYEAAGQVLDSIQIMYVTEGVYAVELQERGVSGVERFFIGVEDAPS